MHAKYRYTGDVHAAVKVALGFLVPLALACAAACSSVLAIDGDGTQDGDAARGDGPSPGDDSGGIGDGNGGDGSKPNADAQLDDALPRAKIVFVTTAASTGELGGITGADALCNAEAKSSGINGTFVAYLRQGYGSSQHAASRLPDAGGGWSRVDGKVAFTTNPQNAVPTNALELTSDAAVVEAGAHAWTGNTTGPTAHCGDGDGGLWTTQFPGLSSAGVGDPHAVNGQWQSGTVRDCNTKQHLYCFEL
jgi:hypothetical protein